MKKSGAKLSPYRKMIPHETRQLNALLSERIEEQTTELRLARAEMDNFAHAVSHDLRAPLIHIGGFVDLLFEHLEQKLDEQGRHYLATITASTYQMGRMIDEVIEYSGLNRMELRYVSVDLDVMVKEVIDEMRALGGKRHVVWMIGHLPVVQADPTLLRQVVFNLAANALKFTAPREDARIHVTARRGDGEVIFSIRDNGVGFDMKYRPKLFGLFQRLHPAAEFEGHGVGLAQVARIIQRHGGRTWADGVLGGGADFRFSLPDGPNGRSFMNPTPYALYAEDNATTAQLLMKILAGHNPAWKVVHVSDGEEALDFLRSRGRFDGREPHSPAVIFLDVEMRPMDGLEVLQEIRGDENFGMIPVVMLAGTLYPARMQRSYELGANAHLVKPVDFRRFADFVRTLGDFWLTMNEAPALGNRLNG